jgi:hypothetical protein
MSDYRQYLKAVGRKPIKGPLRTEKKAGDVEIAWSPIDRDYIPHVHEGPARLVDVSKRKRAEAA